MKRNFIFCLGSLALGSCKLAGVGKDASKAKAEVEVLSDFDISTAKGKQSPLVEAGSKHVTLQSMIQFFYCTDQGKATRSVEKFTEQLPNYIFDSHALIFNKGSLCGDDIDAKKPRVVLYDKYTGLVIAYTNKPEGGTCSQSLEFMQVTAKQKTTLQEKKPFRFEPKEPYSFFAMNFEKEKAPTIHGPNPTECSNCHQAGATPLLPIWHVNPKGSGNNKWPNVFFGADQTTFEPKPTEVVNIIGNPRLERVSSLRELARPVNAKFVDALVDLDTLFRDAGAIDPEPAGFVSEKPQNIGTPGAKAISLALPITVDCDAGGGGGPSNPPTPTTQGGACVAQADASSQISCGCWTAPREIDCLGPNTKLPKQCGVSPIIKFVAGGSCPGK